MLERLKYMLLVMHKQYELTLSQKTNAETLFSILE